MTNQNLFRAAIPYLTQSIMDKRGRAYPHICDALKTASWFEKKTPGSLAFTTYIMSQLAPHKTVQQWCMWNVPGFAETLRNSGKRYIHEVPALYDELQAFRHRWLRHLADEFDKGNI